MPGEAPRVRKSLRRIYGRKCQLFLIPFSPLPEGLSHRIIDRIPATTLLSQLYPMREPAPTHV